MKNKKSQGMPLSVIVIAALVLLVLVILAVIFIGRMGGTTTTLNSCESKSGTCVVTGTCEGTTLPSTVADCGDGQVCCVNV